MDQAHNQSLRILFWNVRDWGASFNKFYEHWRFQRILKVIEDEKPDIACFAEVVGSYVPRRLKKSLNGDYDVHVAASENKKKIVTIFKNAADRKITVSTKTGFAADDGFQRTFPLVEVLSPAHKLAFLAVHTKSRSDEESHQIRTVILRDIANLAASFNAKAIPFMVAGDMNTMGNGWELTGPDEIREMESILSAPPSDLVLLKKDRPHTWKGIGSDAKFGVCDFDHVLVSRDFRAATLNKTTVRVGGWPQYDSQAAQEKWVRGYSDHAYLVADIRL